MAYSTVDDIDPYVGALAEDPVQGNLGELNRASLKDQFHRMRAGDRFWYENDQFEAAELEDIRATRLVDIIQRNTNITYRYRNAFFTHDSQLDGGLFAPKPIEDLALVAEFEFWQRLDDGFMLHWTIDRENFRIKFAAHCRTKGWMAIGVSQVCAQSLPKWLCSVQLFHAPLSPILCEDIEPGYTTSSSHHMNVFTGVRSRNTQR